MTPDDHTIVFKLDEARPAARGRGPRSLPLSTARCRRSTRSRSTQKTPSDYGNHIVSTGPYMIPNDKTGR